MRTVLQRGAEAVLWLDEQEGEKVVVKQRVAKSYRLPQLDEKMRFQRTKTERAILDRAARAGVNVPRVLDVKPDTLVLEYVEGKCVKDVFNSISEKERKSIAETIGMSVARLHGAGIVHGDLTTSNMIKNRRGLFLFDFGLAQMSMRQEDQAGDLFLLKEAVKAAHFMYLNGTWQYIVRAYRESSQNAHAVLAQLEKIERRRRYKTG